MTVTDTERKRQIGRMFIDRQRLMRVQHIFKRERPASTSLWSVLGAHAHIHIYTQHSAGF